ncbi:MAG TPA: hypothetical protein VKZ60_02050 [Chloroflexota bacterium]|jgi:hypothetical protein|nr:hypothetical protein [Chloroflexota bacterium]
MLRAEAQWLAERLRRLDAAALSPLLDVGSSLPALLRQTQPWVAELLVEPLAHRGVVIQRTDLRAGPGVDFVGDLADPAFVEWLAEQGFRSVLCCNVLEHVPRPEVLARHLVALVPVGGYLVVSVPHRFPYHPDPIDTLFRPNPRQLVALFPQTRCLDSAIVRCGTALQYVNYSPLEALRRAARRFTGTGGAPRTCAGTVSFLPWLFRQFEVTCAVLQRVDCAPAVRGQ